jgi:transposase
MDMHKNARLTAHCRGLLVDRVLKGRPRLQVALEFGISVKTVDKWLKRYQSEGPAGLADRSCRPRFSPAATVKELQLAVIALRRQRLTFGSIGAQLKLSRATVARICAQAGLSRLSRLDLPAPVQRYERCAPGELLHLDVKKLGRITQIGHRITGDKRRRHPHSGWEFVHVAIDDASRVAYSQILPDEEADSAVVFLRAARLLRWARRANPRGHDRQRWLLPQPPVRSSVSGFGSAASLHSSLYPAHQWQSRTIHPKLASRMGIRTGLSTFCTAHRGSAVLAAPIQLAPPSLELGGPATHIQTGPQQEQSVETSHLANRAHPKGTHFDAVETGSGSLGGGSIGVGRAALPREAMAPRAGTLNRRSSNP